MGGEHKIIPRFGKDYFQFIQPHCHHTNVPMTNKSSSSLFKINNYSFALTPEQHQPCGHCNFGEIKDKKTLEFSSKVKLNAIYNLEYDVLRIGDGKATLKNYIEEDYLPDHLHLKQIAKNIDRIA